MIYMYAHCDCIAGLGKACSLIGAILDASVQAGKSISQCRRVLKQNHVYLLPGPAGLQLEIDQGVGQNEYLSERGGGGGG